MKKIRKQFLFQFCLVNILFCPGKTAFPLSRHPQVKEGEGEKRSSKKMRQERGTLRSRNKPKSQKTEKMIRAEFILFCYS